MAAVSVMLVGPEQRREFQPVVDWLGQNTRLTVLAEMTEAWKWLLETSRPPELIVAAAARPGEFSAREIESLRSAAPLARIIALLGSWCEGEMRTGKPWPGVVRVYWHRWLACCAEEIRRLEAGKPSLWGLPLTAGEDERIEQAVAWSPASRAGLVVVAGRDADSAEALLEALQGAGCGAVWLDPAQPARIAGASAVIFTAASCCAAEEGDEIATIAELAQRFAPAPLVALLDFPRWSDRDAALSAGAAAVLGRPYLLADLFHVLNQAQATTGRSDTRISAA